MSHALTHEIGTVVSVWRYPVKSLLGEEVPMAHVTNNGIFGDRAYAILDLSDGKISTAKNPRNWPTLFTFKATCFEAVDWDEKTPPLRIILPDGAVITSEQSDVNQTLSKALKREVRLLAVEQGKVKGVQSSLPALWTGQSEEYWPDIGGRNHRDTTTDFTLPEGTFFDAATLHLLTTATLNQLRMTYPSGRFEIQRFRPNIVVEPTENLTGFIENSWIGDTVAIGDEVRLTVTEPCSRCVMTTLPQENLPKDAGILRTALQQNQGNVGVYARVVRSGTIYAGDRVRVEL